MTTRRVELTQFLVGDMMMIKFVDCCLYCLLGYRVPAIPTYQELRVLDMSHNGLDGAVVLDTGLGVLLQSCIRLESVWRRRGTPHWRLEA